MPKSSESSPIFQFLTQKENLPAVLEVIRYTEQIRNYVAERFWDSLEKAIKKNPKARDDFSWERRLPDKSDRAFFLIARPPHSLRSVKACNTVSKPQRIILASGLIGIRMPAKLRNFANYNRSKHCKLNLKNGAATSIRNQIPTRSGGSIGRETPTLILIRGLGLLVILTMPSSMV